METFTVTESAGAGGSTPGHSPVKSPAELLPAPAAALGIRPNFDLERCGGESPINEEEEEDVDVKSPHAI
jgi:hypothetical protein